MTRSHVLYAPVRVRLNSVFGYSSTCVPSILSGRWPDEHRHWCFFVYDQKNSPFRFLRALRWLPEAITARRRFRRWLSRFLKTRLNFRGYFDLYNIPFRYIHLFNYSEKRSPLKPGGMNCGKNICDFLIDAGINHFFPDPAWTEEQNRDQLVKRIESEEIDFAFVYRPDLDGLLHRVGNQSPEISAKLRVYERWIGQILKVARLHYREVRLYVFSDHGMANCERLLDLRKEIDSLSDLRMGRDYVVVYDSTMARFWFVNDRARSEITDCLGRQRLGRILSDTELSEMRVLFQDRYFGELIFLVEEGVLIVPSHMGDRPLKGMHGYHPAAPHSYACLCTNQPEIPAGIRAIPDIYTLMTSDALLAKAQNGNERGPNA